MKKFGKYFVILALVGFFAGILSVGISNAQIIRVNEKVVIVKADRPNNRLEVRVHPDDNPSIQYVLMDDQTKFSTGNKELTFDEAWSRFKKDMIIRVKGGYTVDLKIKARYIYW